MGFMKKARACVCALACIARRTHSIVANDGTHVHCIGLEGRSQSPPNMNTSYITTGISNRDSIKTAGKNAEKIFREKIKETDARRGPQKKKRAMDHTMRFESEQAYGRT